MAPPPPFLTESAAESPSSAPTASVAAIATAFSEYQDIDAPRYYDLPVGPSADPEDVTFWSLDDDDVPGPGPSVAAIDFVSADATSSRLVLALTLWVGKRAVQARALIDSGSEGDFVDSRFTADHLLGLLRRKYPIKCSSFDGSTAAAGPITHFWSGSMTMIGTVSTGDCLPAFSFIYQTQRHSPRLV